MKNYVFLDIDGVLNDTTNRIEKDPKYKYRQSNDICKTLVRILNKLYDYVEYDIIVSSSWRVLGIDMLQPIFNEVGIRGNIVGVTDYIIGSDRGFEINKYIEENNIENYVVIDDDVCDIMDHIPHTRITPIDPEFGITILDVLRCKNILKGNSVSSNIKCVCQMHKNMQ